jgi:Resolvase, N terminal domain
VALVGPVRVSTSKQETARQHDVLDSICSRAFEEKISGKLAVDARAALTAALDYMRTGDILTVQGSRPLGRNLLVGLLVLNDLFCRGIAVKVLKGIAASPAPTESTTSTVRAPVWTVSPRCRATALSAPSLTTAVAGPSSASRAASEAPPSTVSSSASDQRPVSTSVASAGPANTSATNPIPRRSPCR